jgi:hypothetical protein
VFKSRWGHGNSSLVFVVCCESSDELIISSEESYRVCVFVCIPETSTVWRPRPELDVMLEEEEEEEEEKKKKKKKKSIVLTIFKIYFLHERRTSSSSSSSSKLHTTWY